MRNPGHGDSKKARNSPKQPRWRRCLGSTETLKRGREASGVQRERHILEKYRPSAAKK